MKDSFTEGRSSKGGVGLSPTKIRPLPPKGKGGTQPTDVQRLKAEIAALADEIAVMNQNEFSSNDARIYNKLRQLSAV